MLNKIRQTPLGSRSLQGGKPLELEAWVRDAGHYAPEYPHYRVPGLEVPAKLSRCAFQYTLSGEGALVYEGRERAVRAGSLMLLVSPHDYVYFTPPGQRWEFFYLTLEGPVIERIWRRVIARLGPVITMAEDEVPLQTAAAFALEIFGDNFCDPWRNSETAYALAMRLLRWAMRAPYAGRPAEYAKAMEKAVDCARRRFADPIGVEDLARAAGMSRFHFSRLFKAHVGISPGEFILQERLQAAADLLQTTAERIADVASRSGFSNPTHFGKLFRRRFGLTPQAFRVRHAGMAI